MNWCRPGRLLALLARHHTFAGVVLALGMGGVVPGLVGWKLGDGRPLPRILQLPAFGLMGNVAAMHALFRAMKGQQDAVWEPTRRDISRAGS